MKKYKTDAKEAAKLQAASFVLELFYLGLFRSVLMSEIPTAVTVIIAIIIQITAVEV